MHHRRVIGLIALGLVGFSVAHTAASQSINDLLKNALKKAQHADQVQSPPATQSSSNASDNSHSNGPESNATSASLGDGFKMQCDSAEKVFNSSCVGKVSGAIGYFDPSNRMPSQMVDALKALQIIKVAFSPLQGPDKNWHGILCQLAPENVRWAPREIPKDPIIGVPLLSCNLGNKVWHLEDIYVYNTSNGLVIGQISGKFKGNPGNSPSQGPFNASLVQRYGAGNCNDAGENGFCRMDKTKIVVSGGENAAGEVSFKVDLIDERVPLEARSAAEQRAKKLTESAPVNSF